MELRLGVDVGGTFTDAVGVAADGRVTAAKVLSTPLDQGVGVVAALDATGVPPTREARIHHGTTVVTNLLLERTGARVVLCATDGAEDLLRLRRQDRAALYDLTREHPAPLVADDDVVAVDERTGPDGVLRALTRDEAQRVVAAVQARDPEAVVVSLLHAATADAHERQVGDALALGLRGRDVVLASAVLPETREYERTATAVAEGYARPRVALYLGMLQQRLASRGWGAPAILTSGGGMLDASEAARHAAALALSGPAGGVVGAAAFLRALDLPLALTIDIGGTSADAGLVVDGEPLVEPGGTVAGVPIALPRVLVETVSAGGGSLAWRDEAGALRVGPRSAGVDPGPAAFGRGGRTPTVTDAHVVLGHIAPRPFQSGLAIDAEAAAAAVDALAASLGEPRDRVARAILEVADAEMARALRRVSVDRGIDPRDAVLVAFGGGGPLHGCALAEALGMQRVLVPPHAGVLSALGLALAPERREAQVAVMRTAAQLTRDDLAWGADGLRRRTGTGQSKVVARARYAGQGSELEVPWADGDDGAALASRFATLHKVRFGYTLTRDVEVVALRCVTSGPAPTPRWERRGPAWDAAAGVDHGGPGEAQLEGPATVALPDATLRIAVGWRGRMLPQGGWMLERTP